MEKINFYLVTSLMILQACYPIRDISPVFFKLIIGVILIILSSKKIDKPTIFILAFEVYIIIKILIGQNFHYSFFSPIKFLVKSMLLLFFYRLSIYSYKRINHDYLIKVLKISTIVTLFFSLYYIHFVDPQAVRNTYGVNYLGVGDFEFVYSLIVISPIFYYEMLEKRKKSSSIFQYFILFYFILKANFATAIILLIISGLLSILILKKINVIYKYIVIIFIFIIFITKKYIANIFLSLSNSDFFYWSTQNKLLAIHNILIGTGSTNTAGKRMDLIRISWNSFKENLIFGIDFKNYGLGVIGGHTQWIDSLGIYGIFGTLLMIFMLYSVYKRQIKCCNEVKKERLVKTIWIMFIVTGFFNPNFNGLTFLYLFLIPFIY